MLQVGWLQSDLEFSVTSTKNTSEVNRVHLGGELTNQRLMILRRPEVKTVVSAVRLLA